MVKRYFILLMVCLMFMPTHIAFADAIFEKASNDFFNNHENECVYLGRSFQVNGADGFVQIKKEPGSNRGGPEIENGEIVYIDYSCLYKGEYWGLARNENGWIKIDGQLLVLYDYVAFEEEHLDDFYTYKGDYAEIKKAKAAVAWPWPGADAPLWTIEDLDTTNFRVHQ